MNQRKPNNFTDLNYGRLNVSMPGEDVQPQIRQGLRVGNAKQDGIQFLSTPKGRTRPGKAIIPKSTKNSKGPRERA